MSYILHIDTSGSMGLIALSKSGKPVAREVNESERDHASTINLHIEAVLKRANIAINDLNAIAVIGGPGSYTGLRIGLATAKGLCYAAEKPLLLYNKLDVMCLQQASEDTSKKYDSYISILPARQQEYFIARYDNTKACTLTPQHIHKNELENLLSHLQGHTLIAGVLNEDLNLKGNIDLTQLTSFNEDFWFSQTFENYKEKGFTDIANATPFYLKEAYTTQSKKV